MLQVLIVDDELKSRENLKIMLEECCKDAKILALAATVDEALKMNILHKPNVVLLDIQMSRETGFDFLMKVEKANFEVVFTTAYAEYAIEAIKFSNVDFLLKPIDIEELKSVVDKFHKDANNFVFQEKLPYLLENIKADANDNFKLVLPTTDGLSVIVFKDIIFCKSEDNKLIFKMKDGKIYQVNCQLTWYEELLSKYGFFRVNRFYLINLKEIKEYIRGDHGYLIMSDDSKLDLNK